MNSSGTEVPRLEDLADAKYHEKKGAFRENEPHLLDDISFSSDDNSAQSSKSFDSQSESVFVPRNVSIPSTMRTAMEGLRNSRAAVETLSAKLSQEEYMNRRRLTELHAALDESIHSVLPEAATDVLLRLYQLLPWIHPDKKKYTAKDANNVNAAELSMKESETESCLLVDSVNTNIRSVEILQDELIAADATLELLLERLAIVEICSNSKDSVIIDLKNTLSQLENDFATSYENASMEKRSIESLMPSSEVGYLNDEKHREIQNELETNRILIEEQNKIISSMKQEITRLDQQLANAPRNANYSGNWWHNKEDEYVEALTDNIQNFLGSFTTLQTLDRASSFSVSNPLANYRTRSAESREDAEKMQHFSKLLKPFTKGGIHSTSQLRSSCTILPASRSKVSVSRFQEASSYSHLSVHELDKSIEFQDSIQPEIEESVDSRPDMICEISDTISETSQASTESSLSAAELLATIAEFDALIENDHNVVDGQVDELECDKLNESVESIFHEGAQKSIELSIIDIKIGEVDNRLIDAKLGRRSKNDADQSSLLKIYFSGDNKWDEQVEHSVAEMRDLISDLREKLEVEIDNREFLLMELEETKNKFGAKGVEAARRELEECHFIILRLEDEIKELKDRDVHHSHTGVEDIESTGQHSVCEMALSPMEAELNLLRESIVRKDKTLARAYDDMQILRKELERCKLHLVNTNYDQDFFGANIEMDNIDPLSRDNALLTIGSTNFIDSKTQEELEDSKRKIVDLQTSLLILEEKTQFYAIEKMNNEVGLNACLKKLRELQMVLSKTEVDCSEKEQLLAGALESLADEKKKVAELQTALLLLEESSSRLLDHKNRFLYLLQKLESSQQLVVQIEDLSQRNQSLEILIQERNANVAELERALDECRKQCFVASNLFLNEVFMSDGFISSFSTPVLVSASCPLDAKITDAAEEVPNMYASAKELDECYVVIEGLEEENKTQRSTLALLEEEVATRTSELASSKESAHSLAVEIEGLRSKMAIGERDRAATQFEIHTLTLENIEIRENLESAWKTISNLHKEMQMRTDSETGGFKNLLYGHIVMEEISFMSSSSAQEPKVRGLSAVTNPNLMEQTEVSLQEHSGAKGSLTRELEDSKKSVESLKSDLEQAQTALVQKTSEYIEICDKLTVANRMNTSLKELGERAVRSSLDRDEDLEEMKKMLKDAFKEIANLQYQCRELEEKIAYKDKELEACKLFFTAQVEDAKKTIKEYSPFYPDGNASDKDTHTEVESIVTELESKSNLNEISDDMLSVYTLKVESAQDVNVPTGFLGFQPQIYVIANCLHGNDRKTCHSSSKTKDVTSSSDSQWQEELTLCGSPSGILTLTLVSRQLVTADTFLGQVVIDLSEGFNINGSCSEKHRTLKMPLEKLKYSVRDTIGENVTFDVFEDFEPSGFLNIVVHEGSPKTNACGWVTRIQEGILGGSHGSMFWAILCGQFLRLYDSQFNGNSAARYTFDLSELAVINDIVFSVDHVKRGALEISFHSPDQPNLVLSWDKGSPTKEKSFWKNVLEQSKSH